MIWQIFAQIVSRTAGLLEAVAPTVAATRIAARMTTPTNSSDPDPVSERVSERVRSRTGASESRVPTRRPATPDADERREDDGPEPPGRLGERRDEQAERDGADQPGRHLRRRVCRPAPGGERRAEPADQHHHRDREDADGHPGDAVGDRGGGDEPARERRGDREPDRAERQSRRRVHDVAPSLSRMVSTTCWNSSGS